MISTLKDAAYALSVIAPDLKSGSGKALEAEVLFALAAEAQRGSYAEVKARNHRGNPLKGAFVLRGGPGHLADPNAAGPKPSYFEVVFGEQAIELHNSLEFTGASGVEHEVDVCAVWAVHAQSARTASKRVMNGPPLLGVELKEFGVDANLAKNMVRAFFACIVDFIPLWAVRYMTIGRPGFLRDFWAERRSELQFWMLTTGELSKPSKDFAEAHDIKVIDKLDRRALDTAISTMVGRLHSLAILDPPAKPSHGSAMKRHRKRKFRALQL